MNFDVIAKGIAENFGSPYRLVEGGRTVVFYTRFPESISYQECIGDEGYEQLQWFRLETCLGRMMRPGDLGYTALAASPEALLRASYVQEGRFVLRLSSRGRPIVARVDRYALPASLPDGRMISILCHRLMSPYHVQGPKAVNAPFPVCLDWTDPWHPCEEECPERKELFRYC